MTSCSRFQQALTARATENLYKPSKRWYFLQFQHTKKLPSSLTHHDLHLLHHLFLGKPIVELGIFRNGLTYVLQATIGSVVAQMGPAAVNLGTAGNYAILAETGITCVPTCAVSKHTPRSSDAAVSLTYTVSGKHGSQPRSFDLYYWVLPDARHIREIFNLD